MNEQPNQPNEDELNQWNMAKLFMWELHQLIELKDRAAMNDDLIGWHRGLGAILRKISWKISTKEYSDARGILKKLHQQIQNAEAYQHKPQFAGFLIKGIVEELDRTDTIIQSYLNKYHLLFPESKTRGLAGLRERMKLEGVQ